MHGSQGSGDRTVEALAADVREGMARLGYSQETQRHYQATWSRLAAFALERESEGVSVELAEAFLVHSGVGSTGPGAPAASSQCHLRAAMRFLLEFQMHGCFQRRRSISRLGLPGEFARIMSEYEQFCTHELGIKHRTMRGRRRNVVRLLMHHASRASTDVRTIDVETVSDFLKSWCHLRPQTLALVVCDLRSFLRFLAMKGDVPAELVERVPKVRIRHDARIPDVWRAEDVGALLAAVDRGSPVGKRDYAILLLAARLGLRAGDIRDLRLDDLRWDEARIEHTQSKTGRPVVLPLTEDADRVPAGRTASDSATGGLPAVPGSFRALRARQQPAQHHHQVPVSRRNRASEGMSQGPSCPTPHGRHPAAGGGGIARHHLRGDGPRLPGDDPTVHEGGHSSLAERRTDSRGGGVCVGISPPVRWPT